MSRAIASVLPAALLGLICAWPVISRADEEEQEPVVVRAHPVGEMTKLRGFVWIRGPQSLQDEVKAHVEALRALKKRADAYSAAEAKAVLGEDPGESIVQIHSVLGMLEEMPVVELVGPEGTRRVGAVESLILAVKEHIAPLDVWDAMPDVDLRTEKTYIIVKAPPVLQKRVDAALKSIRAKLAERR